MISGNEPSLLPFRGCRLETASLAVSIIVVALSLLGGLTPAHWFGELIAQPRHWYAILLLFCAVLLARRLQKPAAFILVAASMNAMYLFPLYVDSPAHRNEHYEHVTIAHVNVDRFNETPDAAFTWIRGLAPSIVSLQELTPEMAAALPAALPDYEVALSHPLANSHGSAVLVKRGTILKIASARIVYLPETSERPLIECVLETRDRKLALLSLHVTRPLGKHRYDFQSLELAEASRWAEEQQAMGRAVVVIGDLNLTPWSPRFRALCRDSGLVNSQNGFGVQGTWPATAPSFLGFPIDHCLHGASIHTKRRVVGPNMGSDHRPLFVELSIPREE